jgi:hypothetical protein
LTYFLSWYEKTDMNTMHFVRKGSKWTLDLAIIRQRKELAHSVVDYAKTDEYIPDIRCPVKAEDAEGSDSSQDEDEAEDEGDAEADAPEQRSVLAGTGTIAPSVGSGTPAADTSTGIAPNADGSASGPAS